MRNTSAMIETDNNRAIAILESIKGCIVADDNNNRYQVDDVKVFNGQVYAIGLNDIPTGFVKYVSLDCYMEMASVG